MKRWIGWIRERWMAVAWVVAVLVGVGMLIGNAVDNRETPTPPPAGPATESLPAAGEDYGSLPWLDNAMEELNAIPPIDPPQQTIAAPTSPDPIALLVELREQAGRYLREKEIALKQEALSKRAMEVAEDLVQGQEKLTITRQETAERWKELEGLLK